MWEGENLGGPAFIRGESVKGTPHKGDPPLLVSKLEADVWQDTGAAPREEEPPATAAWNRVLEQSESAPGEAF